MRTILLVSLLSILLCGISFAQDGGQGYRTHTVFNSLTYANDDADTSGTLTVGGFGRVSFWYYVSDTADIDYVFQTKPIGSSTWSAVTALAVDSVDVDAATRGEIVLRDQNTNRILGPATQIRVIANFASSGNDSQGTATHIGRLYLDD